MRSRVQRDGDGHAGQGGITAETFDPRRARQLEKQESAAKLQCPTEI